MTDDGCVKCQGSGHVVRNAGMSDQEVVACPDCTNNRVVEGG